MKQQNFFDDPKGVLQDIQQQSMRLQQQAERGVAQSQPQRPPDYITSHEHPQRQQYLSSFTVPSALQQASRSSPPITTTSSIRGPGLFPSTSVGGSEQTHSPHTVSLNRRPKPGILRLDMSKPRRSSGGSVEFRMQPQMIGAANISTPFGTTTPTPPPPPPPAPPPHHLSVTWATPPCDSIEREFKIKSTTPSTPAAAAGATDATLETGGGNVELSEITAGRKRSSEEKPYEFSLSYAAGNLASPVTEPFIDFPLHRHYEDCHNQSPGYSIHTANTDNTNDNEDDDDDDDEEDYSVSVSAIMQRRASVRGYRRKSSSRNSRRASSPMDHVLDNAERRRSSVYTTSSDEGTNPESTQEQIFENIRLHKEVIQSVKLQPWPIRKKLKLVRQAKTYVARHEGALQERFAMSRSTRDLWARFKILMAARWRHWKREIYSFLTVLIPWELRIKEIESHFGSGVASYFTFLRWLMWLNLMIALPLVLFVIGPEYFATKHDVMDPRKKMTYRENNVAGNLLTIWEFEGHLKYSPMFYGYYSGANKTEPHASGAYALGYVLPLAYFLTAVVVYIYSFVATLKKMAENSRNSKLSEKDDECTFSWKLFTGWDFMIGHAETAHNRIASVVLNFKEALLEEAEKKKDNRDWRIIMQRVVVNVLVIGLLGASGVSVVYLVSISEELNKKDDWLSKNAVNVCMNLLALIMPMIFEALGFFEHWHPRQQLRLQLARVMILNLLNLYSLMFTSFFKIESKGAPLHDLQAKNISATRELEDLNKNWKEYLAMAATISTTTEPYNGLTTLISDNSTLMLPNATESLMTGVTDVVKKIFCYNVTVRCSKNMRVTKSYPFPPTTTTTTLATTTLMLLNLTTTMMPILTTTDQPVESTWTTTASTTGITTTPTTDMPFNTTASEPWTTITTTTTPFTTPTTTWTTTPPTTTSTPFSQSTPTTTTERDETTTSMTTTTTEYPGNDTVFDYYDYFGGLSLNVEDLEGNEEKEGQDEGENILKTKGKRENKRDNEMFDDSNEVFTTTIKPKKPKGKRKGNKVKQAKSNSPDALSLQMLRKSKYSRRAKDADTALLSSTPSNRISQQPWEPSPKSTTESSLRTTRQLRLPYRRQSIQDSNNPSTSSYTTKTPRVTTTESSVGDTEISEGDASFRPSPTNPTYTTTSRSVTGTFTPLTTTSKFATSSTEQYDPESETTTTIPPELIWEPNVRLQDLVDFFTTSTAKPRGSYNPTTTRATTTTTSDEDYDDDVSTTPFFLDGDLETSQTVWHNYNEVDYENFGNCIRTVCDEVTTPVMETTTKPTTTTTKMIVTTTISPQQEYEMNRTRIEKVIDGIELQLTTMCWETALGQELSKVIVLDALMAIGTSLIIDFLRALFVRYVNQNWCWDMEKTFPQYGDFKIAENILMLINNQGQVWMGIFFSPGLVIINLVKLVVMMYFRSWIVLTCNVPHEVVFKASKSNNFYLALLLTVLFLCVLPVGYAIVWLRPSWHCGPFSKYDTISHYIIHTTMLALPEQFHKPLEYLTSSSTVIPLLLLMMLIIYYLISLTGALREANQDLKTQLQKEREEERKKFFKVPEIKASENNSLTMSNRWRKVLEASSPVTPTATQPDFESEEYKSQARKELISRIMKKALRKDSATSDEEFLARHGRDDDTDTEHHDSLPHDEDGKGGMSRLQQIRRTRKPSLVDIVQIANSERERLRSLHHQPHNGSGNGNGNGSGTGNGNGGNGGNGEKESHPRGRFKVERPDRKHEKEEHEKERQREKENDTNSTDMANDPEIKTRVINERRQSLLRRKKEDEEKHKDSASENVKPTENDNEKETEIDTENKKTKEEVDKDNENNKDTERPKRKNGDKEFKKLKDIKAKENQRELSKAREAHKPNSNQEAEENKQMAEEERPSSPIRKRIYESFRRKKRDGKEKLAALKQNSLEKTNEEEGKPEETDAKETIPKDSENGGKKKSLSLRKKAKRVNTPPDEAQSEKSPPNSSFKVVDEKSGATALHDDKHSALTLEHLHNLGEKFKFKLNKHKSPTEPEVFKFDTDKIAKEADIATTPTLQHLESELQSPRPTGEVNTPPSSGHLHLGADKLANFSRQSRRKIGSFLTLVKDAVKKTDHEMEHSPNPETTIDIPETPSIQMSSALNNAFMLPLALHAPTNANTSAHANATTTPTDSIQPYIMPRAPLEIPEDIDPPSYSHSMETSDSRAAPPTDTEELDKPGPIVFPQRRVSQRRRPFESRAVRQDSLTSNWSVENIPTITISTTPEGDDQPKSTNIPPPRGTEASAPIPIPKHGAGPKVNVIKIHIDK